jgi:hypothetical protein
MKTTTNRLATSFFGHYSAQEEDRQHWPHHIDEKRHAPQHHSTSKQTQCNQNHQQFNCCCCVVVVVVVVVVVFAYLAVIDSINTEMRNNIAPTAVDTKCADDTNAKFPNFGDFNKNLQ